ncbi:hypothetical protein WJ0W_004932 [Paenibacillus melissococcoides]|uniref:Uncharacterized protein n=1 Tax=Paenibacillus melissococcoides TaxID=2912268 RepID=A0ABM9G8I5_9BACL|nr:hypothetical protein WJ0W_004932 [Paenibacillus melissococcoides]
MLQIYSILRRLSRQTEEFLQIYIILFPFAPNQSKMREIPAFLQESLFDKRNE